MNRPSAPGRTACGGAPCAAPTRAPMTFFLLVFALSVPFWLVGAMTGLQLMPGLSVSALMTFCPLAAALILVHRENGVASQATLLRSAFDFQRIDAKPRSDPAAGRSGGTGHRGLPATGQCEVVASVDHRRGGDRIRASRVGGAAMAAGSGLCAGAAVLPGRDGTPVDRCGGCRPKRHAHRDRVRQRPSSFRTGIRSPASTARSCRPPCGRAICHLHRARLGTRRPSRRDWHVRAAA